MKLLVATAAACVISCSAYAADIVYDIPAPPVAPPLPAKYNWTGAYIGLSGGVATGDFKYQLPSETGDSVTFLDLTGGGFIGGAQAGYDWQVNNWVIGAVADIAATNHKADIFAGRTGFDPAWMEFRLTYLGTLRARVGHAWDRGLLYGHGGFAYGQIKQTISLAGEPTNKSRNSTTGWTIGAGVEYAVTDRLTFGTEYSYVDLGYEEIFRDGSASAREDVALHTVKALINVRF